MKTIAMIVLLAAAAAPGALPAQSRMPGAGAVQRETGPVDALLKHRTELRLTDDQVTRLRAIDQRLEEQNRALREQLRANGLDAARERGRRTRELSEQERDQLRERMQAARPVMERIRENNRAARDQVRQVLTPEQQDRLRNLRFQKRQQMHGERAGKRGEQRRPRRDGARRQGRNP